MSSAPLAAPEGMELSGVCGCCTLGDVFYVVLGGSGGQFGGLADGVCCSLLPHARGAAVIESSSTLGECSWLQPRGRWMCPAPVERGQLQFKLGGWSSSAAEGSGKVVFDVSRTERSCSIRGGGRKGGVPGKHHFTGLIIDFCWKGP